MKEININRQTCDFEFVFLSLIEKCWLHHWFLVLVFILLFTIIVYKNTLRLSLMFYHGSLNFKIIFFSIRFVVFIKIRICIVRFKDFFFY